MSQLFNLPGPHDVPFAAPLLVAAMTGFVIAFVLLKLLDHVDVKNDQDKD